MMNSDDVLQEFLVESYENLDRLDRELVALEKTPDSKEMLSSIFRTIHTIKGTSGFFGFSKLGTLTHVGENLLSLLRDGELRIDGAITSALLKMVDAVREMLASIEHSHDEGDGDYSALEARLAALLTPTARAAEASGREDSDPDAAAFAAAGVEQAAADKAAADKAAADKAAADKAAADKAVADNAAADKAAADKAAMIAAADKAVAARAAARAAADKAAADKAAADKAAADKAAIADAASAAVAAAASANAAATSAGTVADASIRVDTTILDKLMNLAGELVLARNQIMQVAGKLQDPTLSSTCQRLNLITSEMQEGMMRTRMQPIGNLLTKLPRVVRDLAVACGKEVRIELEGKETDLDRTVLEAIKDPLTHIIRNCVDHGIELPQVRLAAGKPAEGTLRVRAFHQSGQVNIEITDDGAGVDCERVKKKAIERGLISASEAARMTERDLVNLIFLAGFSTAEKVTSVSGRGVGMDVVKTNVQKIGGSVDVQSKLGHGTCLRIKIPLTMAIIPVLIVTSAGDRYAIPQVSVHELVRLKANAERGIERIHGTPVYRLRGNLLPLVNLDEQLDCAGEGGAHAINIVVVQAEDRTFGLVVDDVNDTEEIVVKPLDRQMKGAGPFAGATILGDGRVALILDVRSLAQQAHVLGDRREAAAPKLVEIVEEQAGIQTLLLLSIGREGRVALRLDDVARLEQFELTNIERSGAREVVQYRDRILPLLRVADALSLSPDEAQEASLQVVVHTDRSGKSVGLVVDRILDIVREPVTLEGTGRVEGVLGSAVIGKRVTELLDVEGLMRGAGLAQAGE